jgi:hypothetical protein
VNVERGVAEPKKALLLVSDETSEQDSNLAEVRNAALQAA